MIFKFFFFFNFGCWKVFNFLLKSSNKTCKNCNNYEITEAFSRQKKQKHLIFIKIRLIDSWMDITKIVGYNMLISYARGTELKLFFPQSRIVLTLPFPPPPTWFTVPSTRSCQFEIKLFNKIAGWIFNNINDHESSSPCRIIPETRWLF